MPIDAVVSVSAFTVLLWWVPKSEVRALPVLCALVFAPYWVEAAFIAYVTVLFFGTLLMLVDAWNVFSEK